MKTKNKTITIRNLVAATMRGKSKRFMGRGNRRPNDARRSWRNEEH